MKSILLVTSILLCSSAMAQPILTAANTNPVPDDVYTLTQYDTTGITAVSTGPGTGMTWDYSHITPMSSSDAPAYGVSDSLAVLTFVNPSTTPYYTAFPNATVAAIRRNALYSYLWPYDGITDSLYEYFIADSGQYFFTIDETDAATPIPCSQPITSLSYPFTYHSRSVDTSDYYYAPGEETTRTTDTFTADAYGTLKLPSGTYTHALRVHVTTFIADTLYVYGDTATLNNMTTDSYQWYVPGFHVPVLVIDNYTLGGVPENVYYYTGTFDSSESGIGPDSTDTTSSVRNLTQVLQKVTVYPNPAFDDLHITYTSLTGQPATMHLTDEVGKCVRTISNDNPAAGVNETTISVSALPSGIYLLQVQSGGNVVSKKINILR